MKIDSHGQPPFHSGFWSGIVSKKIIFAAANRQTVDSLPQIQKSFVFWSNWFDQNFLYMNILGPQITPRRCTSIFHLVLSLIFARHEKLSSLSVGGTTWVESSVLLRTHTISSSRGFSPFWAKRALWLSGVDRHSNDYALGHKTRERHVRSKF